MPPKTYKCGGCLADRVESRFSNTAIRKYEQAKRAASYNQSNRNKSRGQAWAGNDLKDANTVPLPRCMLCTSGSIHELKCYHCEVVKSLESFSKQMRKDPDHALCHNCSQDQQDLEPHHKDQVHEEITMERLRAGWDHTTLGLSSASAVQSAYSRGIAQSNGPSASTHYDAASDWFQEPIPIPDDRRAVNSPGSYRTRSPSNISNAYSSARSAVTGTDWDHFARTDASYREQKAYHRNSAANSSNGGGNPNFVKQGAVKLDGAIKAQKALERQQMREKEQAEQRMLHESDEDDSGDDSDAY